METKCVHCGRVFTHAQAANMIIFCPGCDKCCGAESEYGFGPIAPCSVYWGDREIGEITLHGGSYRLTSDLFGIDRQLEGGYADLAAYDEATRMIAERISAAESAGSD